jgi:uncharacterized protein (TIGR03083 family)
MEIAEHFAALRLEGTRMADALAAADAGAAVPTCPEWAVRDLARHTGGVHRWATAVVSVPHTELYAVDFEEMVGGWPEDGPPLVSWFREGHTALVDALSSAPADLECWTFLPAPSPLAMWARRQALETAVHRVDAELAAGLPVTSVDAACAADGVDELLLSFAPRRRSLRADPAVSLGVACADADAHWIVDIGPDQVKAARTAPETAGAADCALRGSASDLFLTLWNRRGTDGLDVEGDLGVLGLLRDEVQVRRG